MALNLNHLPPPIPSLGTEATFGESVSAAFRQQRIVDSMFGLETEIADAYRENLAKAAELSGMKELQPGERQLESVLSPLSLRAATRRHLKLDPFKTPGPQFLIEQQLSGLDTLDAKLREAATQFPGEVRTLDQIIEGVRDLRLKTLEESGDVQARSRGVKGFLGSLIGGVAGSFSPSRDPLLVGSLFVPLGAGRTLASRIFAEALAGGATEALQQGLAVQPTQRLLGEPHTDPVASILYAAAGAGVFRAGLEGAGAFAARIRSRQTRIDLENAVAEATGRHFEANNPADEWLMKRALEGRPLNEDILTALRKTRDTPERTIAEIALTRDIETARLSPLGRGREAELATLASVDRYWREFEGLPQADTALGQILDNPAGLRFTPEFEAGVRARAQQPEMYQRLDFLEERYQRYQEAQGRLEERIASIESRRPTSPEQAAELSPTVRNRLREIERELGRKPSEAKKAKLEEERGFLTRSAGSPLSAEEGANLNILKENLAELKQEIQSIRKGLFPLRREANKLEEKSRAALQQEKAAPSGTDSTAEASPFKYDEQVEKLVPKVDEEGRIDIGGASKIDENLQVPDSLGETGKIRSAKAVLEEIADEEAAAKAAKECGV